MRKGSLTQIQLLPALRWQSTKIKKEENYDRADFNGYFNRYGFGASGTMDFLHEQT